MLKTKAKVTVDEYDDNYFMVGPLIETIEVEELECPHQNVAKAMTTMRDKGIKIVFGRWLIKGTPQVILFDLESAKGFLNEWKTDFWNNFSINFPENDNETTNSLLLGYLSVWFLGEYLSIEPRTRIIAHFHEWMVPIKKII